MQHTALHARRADGVERAHHFAHGKGGLRGVNEGRREIEMVVAEAIVIGFVGWQAIKIGAGAYLYSRYFVDEPPREGEGEGGKGAAENGAQQSEGVDGKGDDGGAVEVGGGAEAATKTKTKTVGANAMQEQAKSA